MREAIHTRRNLYAHVISKFFNVKLKKEKKNLLKGVCEYEIYGRGYWHKKKFIYTHYW